ncbi:unnamed protein product [Victoria cruziana]
MISMHFTAPPKIPSAPTALQLAFYLHTALLHQAFAHCRKFPTAASCRSLGRVLVPVWLIILSDQLMIIALVSYCLTNKLIRREPLLGQIPPFAPQPIGY